MALTPNYGFIIPTGSDAVNLLTQCYPNFSSLDTILKPIQESGVTIATDTKVGTVHQLVRTDSSCNMFRFIATGNYASGDTFTVDGASVTATAMDGTSLPAGAFVINQNVVCVLNNLVLTVLIAGKETTSISASAVTYNNTVSGLTATNAQDAIDELRDSANIAYDNTASGLTATDVQSALDEIASGSGADHGVYESWVNPDSTVPFNAQTTTFSASEEYDQLLIFVEERVGETLTPMCYGIDKGISASNLRYMTASGFDTATPLTLKIYTRPFTVAYSNGTYTIVWSNCTSLSKLTNSSTASSVVNDNTSMIPVRILGVVHNN